MDLNDEKLDLKLKFNGEMSIWDCFVDSFADVILEDIRLHLASLLLDEQIYLFEAFLLEHITVLDSLKLIDDDEFQLSDIFS